MELNTFAIEKEDYNFQESKKMISSKDTLEKFLTGKTFKKLLDFICFLQKSVESKSRKDNPFPENVFFLRIKVFIFNNIFSL